MLSRLVRHDTPSKNLDELTGPSLLLATFPNANALLAGRKNPNGCPAKATWFAQVNYSDPILLTQWYASGNEVADHTVTHGAADITKIENYVGSYEEVEGMRAWANAWAGIPLGKIKGFRYPYLNYTADGLKLLQKMGFEYESSMSAMDSDAVWPYTLDHGIVNDCLGQIDLCGGKVTVPGLWEIPLYGISGPDGTHLMDPYNDGNLYTPDLPTVEQDYISYFDKHYGGNRAPFGIYTHPTWFNPPPASAIPTLPQGADGASQKKLAMVQKVLDYAMKKPDTWMVTNAQLIEYMKAPVPASQLASQPYMQCAQTPAPPTNICNGIGLVGVDTCNYPTAQLQTCYGCPESLPTLSNPVPKRNGTKKPVPADCDTIWWDSASGQCLCTADSCSYKDIGRPINLNPGSLNGQSGSSNKTAGNHEGSAKLDSMPNYFLPLFLFLVCLL